MSLLIFTWRRQEIIRRKAEINEKLLAITQKWMDLQSYASSIADGVTLNGLVNAPASMFGPMSIFMMTSNQAAMAGAQEKFNILQNAGLLQQNAKGLNPQMQAQYADYIKEGLFKQEQQKFAKVEQNRLNVLDKQIEQQKAQLETQLSMLNAEEEKVSKAEDEGAKKAAPQYVA